MMSSDEVWRQVLAILAVLGLLTLAIQRLKKPSSLKITTEKAGAFSLLSRALNGVISTGHKPKARRLRKVESLAVTTQHSVHIVSLDGRDLLIATGPQGCTMLPVDQTNGSSVLPRESPDLRKRASA